MLAKTCIVIPCYNEETRLHLNELLLFAENNKEIHLLLIDDCSTDKTFQCISSLVIDAINKNITVLQNDVNKGKAETIRNGILNSNHLGRFKYLGFWDADMATPLNEINWFFHFINHFNEKKVFYGSRCLRLGSTIKRKFIRQFLGRMFATVVSKSLDLPVYDTQCGAKLFVHETAIELFSQPFLSKWFFDVELLFRYKNKYGKEQTLMDFYEVPLQNWEHKEGSKLKIVDFIKAPIQLYRINNAYKT